MGDNVEIEVQENYHVMLVRLEGKIDLLNQSATRTVMDMSDARERLNVHSTRITALELERAQRSGMAMLAKILYGGMGAALAAGVAVLARHWGM